MDDEEEDEDTSNEMQGFGGGIDPSSGSCSATQLSFGFVGAGGGGAAGASLNSAVQALTIHVKDNCGHPEIMIVLAFIESERMAWNMCHTNGFE